MSIRNTILASLFVVLCLFMMATGLLGNLALTGFQQHFLAQAQEEMLEQASGEFIKTARQFCNAYELLKNNSPTGESPENDTLRALASESDQILRFDPLGAPSPDAEMDPAITAIATPDVLTAFFQKAVRGEERELTIDNNRAFLTGKTASPAILLLIALPESQEMIGLGRVQTLSEIRSGALAKIGTAEMTSLVWRTIGFYILLMMLTLSLAWLVLYLFFFKPLLGTFACAGIGSLSTGLSWDDLKEYATHLREVLDQKETIRAKLEQETEVRFQAEEERDRTRNQLDHALEKFERKIESRYAERLQEAQSLLMRREARAIKRHVQQPLESARETAATAGASPEVLQTLEGCLNTVRSLSDEVDSIAHTPKVLALQPWLEEVVRRFGETHNATVETGIQNGMNVSIDPLSLEKALEYVMENALDASPETRAIAVDAVKGDGAVEIRIIDRGNGIEDGARAHILAPFYTLDENRDGLGLSITRSVIRHHGGSLTIRSEAEKGTAVIITLPLSGAPA